MDLLIPLIVFLASAVSVLFFGTRLAIYGDALAFLTGWGRLFVGGMLIALATSLPELSTNISAVRLDPPNPELAVGDIFGSNMVNMFILSAVALAFGGKLFLQKISPQQGYLIVVAASITGLAVLFSGLKLGVEELEIGLSSVILAIVFLVGMWWVYLKRPPPGYQGDGDDLTAVGMSLTKAWILFLGVCVGVVVAGFFLAWSTDEIAETTGIASSTLGILLMALITSMPEVSSAVAAARMGAMDLCVAGLYGSCAFNVTILFYADIFYRDGILSNQAEPAHFVAAGIAVALMLVGLVLILSRARVKSAVAAMALVMMAVAYIAGAAVVATLGATEEDDSGKLGSIGLTSRTPDE